MNYIGSKYTILDFITQSILQTLFDSGEIRQPNQMIFGDLMSGTGVIGARFKELGYNVISNDIQYYGYVLAKHYIENGDIPDIDRRNQLIEMLNAAESAEGFIYNNYSYEGTEGQQFRRMYFSADNAKKCDGIRTEIENLRNVGRITDGEYFFLLASLINSIDKYANTASVYGAFLKTMKKTALKPLRLSPVASVENRINGRVYNCNVNALIRQVKGDILYLDPPYNQRQYCTNYHLLETIALYDNPVIYGKTGLREYSAKKSDFCIKSKAANALADVIENAQFKYIFLSYNNEGLLSYETIENILKEYGNVNVFIKEHKRFKADNTRNVKATCTNEYLFCLIKDNL